MLKEVVLAVPLEGHRIHIKFSDGLEGDVDFKDLAPFEGIFLPLQDKDLFAKLKVNRELGTIEWANGADIAPERLHELLKMKLASAA